MPKTVSKNYLKANMLNIFRELEIGNEELIVTDNNKPVLRIIPFKQAQNVQELFGDFQGQVVYHEDIDTSPLGTWEET
jgi:antitoxin (DNA-binding transcriptional repressor) of toxin-antitoxin stability system